MEMDNLAMNKFMVPADRSSKQYARKVVSQDKASQDVSTTEGSVCVNEDNGFNFKTVHHPSLLNRANYYSDIEKQQMA